MAMEEIPRAQWKDFLNAFGPVHEGWLATIEVFRGNADLQRMVRNLPLKSVVADLQSPGTERISLHLDRPPGPALTHVISRPVRIRVHQTPLGTHEALEVEALDGSTTFLRFRSEALPQVVDASYMRSRRAFLP